MKYKCMSPFSLKKYDEDGFSTGKVICIDAGEVFEVGTENITGGEIRLNSRVKWLEISKKTLNKHFVKVEE